jgi:hypothetical protein
VIALVVAAAFIGALAWYLGMDTVHSVVLGVGILVVTVSWLAVPEILELAWPENSGVDDDGGRGDVRRLSWSLRPRHGRVRQQAVSRIRSLAAARLAARGLDLDDADDRDRIASLIGTRSLHTLVPNPERPPLARDVDSCLDALSRLVGDEDGVPEPTATRPTTMSSILIRRRPS